MNIRKADISEVEKLAELNNKLIEDEQHPNPMDLQQLTQRTTEWLQGDYTCYVAEEDGEVAEFVMERYHVRSWRRILMLCGVDVLLIVLTAIYPWGYDRMFAAQISAFMIVFVLLLLPLPGLLVRGSRPEN